MRRKFVVGNWKMNLVSAEAEACVEGFLPLLREEFRAEVGVAPPYLSFASVRALLAGTPFRLGGQDVFWAARGAFTGRVSASMLVDAGASFCIVGHSETRGRFGKLEVPPESVGYFAESDFTVNLKLRALNFAGVTPILCVGETDAEREAGRAREVIEAQLGGALAGLEGAELADLVVAYEPVWAIGTGKTCDAEEAGRTAGFIRGVLAGLVGGETAQGTRILYGGSVKAANAAELFAQPEVDGGLVGGASLDGAEFANIVRAAG